MRRVESSIAALQRQVALQKSLLSSGKSSDEMTLKSGDQLDDGSDRGVRRIHKPSRSASGWSPNLSNMKDKTAQAQQQVQQHSEAREAPLSAEDRHARRYYVGCFRDGADRDLPDLQKLFLVDPVSCMAKCARSGYKFAGLQAGSECWCGKTVGKHGSHSGCDKHCSANHAYTCGSDYLNDVYFACKPVPLFLFFFFFFFFSFFF